MRFTSRRNFVRTVEFRGKTAVRKLFDSPDDWQRELRLLRQIEGKLNAPGVLHAIPGILLMEYLPFPTLLDELERQEREGFSASPWLALRRWLEQAQVHTGCLPGDGNLRNFLWDVRRSQIFGVDFEGYRPAAMPDVLEELAAFLLEYTPADTPVKQRAAQILCGKNPVSAREALRQRRQNRYSSAPDCSFILLAGGQSSRMGRDKASLPFLGTTLLELQLEKARLLGIDDILVSGMREPVPGARIVPDVYPHRGPLGGLHACLREAKHPHCIVLSVDMPLIPACLLRQLAQSHLDRHTEITLAVHGERWQPLVGVYNSVLSERIEPLIRGGGTPVRALIQSSDCQYHPTPLPEPFFANCNTPESYQSILNG